jgi:hypothetical protein
MVRASFPSRYRTGALLLIGIVVIGLAVGVVSAGDEEKVDLTQDHIVVESGETVVIEDRNTTTPTNFTVNEGGTLIIRDSTLFRIGEHHNDNEDTIKGELIIENSTLKAEYGVPIEKSITSPKAKVLVKNSNIGRIGNRLGVTLYIQSGATVDIRDSNVSMVNGYIAGHSDTQNLSVRRSRLNRFALSIEGAGGESFTITNLTKSVDSLHFSKANSNIMFSNVTIEQPPYVESRISGRGEGLLNVRVVNSSVRATVWTGSNFTAIQSKIYNPNVKFDLLGKEKYSFSNLQRGTRGFKDGYLLNHSNVKIQLINSSVPVKSPPRSMYKGLKINNPGGGHNSGYTDIQITNSSVYRMKIGHNLTADNTSATNLLIYNNNGGVFEFNNVDFGPPGDSLQVIEGANVMIRGNVSFYGEIANPGGSRYFNITRQYPVNISTLSQTNSKEELRVLVINPNGTEIENTSYNPDTEYVFPEVGYNLSNYNESFTLTIQQGNRSISRPLTPTTDTPIQVDFVADDDHWWDPYTDNNGVVDDAGINAAVRDYLSEDGDLTPKQLNTLVRSYLSGTPVRELVEE